MKNRLFATILTLSMCLCLCSCGSKSDSTEGTEALPTDGQADEVITDADFVEAEDVGPRMIGEFEVYQDFFAFETENTVTVPDDYISGDFTILVNELTGEIVAEKNAYERMYPASMTKVLTVLVACERLADTDLDTQVVVPFDATDYSFVNDCSNAGFEAGETVTLRDLLYGVILPSGADAAVTLAIYIAGNQDNFVNLMNDKVAELGLSETTHFTNCVGIYNDDHYTTAYDMSMILKAALENKLAYEFLSCHCYEMPANEFHEEGIVMSNWFLRRIEDHITTGLVVAGKTGYVVQSGSCAVSYEISSSNIPYICVVAHSDGTWGCIGDHVTMYDTYAK